MHASPCQLKEQNLTIAKDTTIYTHKVWKPLFGAFVEITTPHDKFLRIKNEHQHQSAQNLGLIVPLWMPVNESADKIAGMHVIMVMLIGSFYFRDLLAGADIIDHTYLSVCPCWGNHMPRICRIHCSYATDDAIKFPYTSCFRLKYLKILNAKTSLACALMRVSRRSNSAFPGSLASS